MKIGLKWIVSFSLIALVAVGGLFWNPEIPVANTADFLSEDKIVGADVAWILAAAGLVLLMTPGLSFFYGGCHFYYAAELYCSGSYFHSLDSRGLFSFFWRIIRIYF